MPWLWIYIIVIIGAGILDAAFNYGEEIGEAMFCGFLVVSLFAAIIGLGVGTSYSQKAEHYHFIDKTYDIVVCDNNTVTLTKDAQGRVIYNYIYTDENGLKISSNFSADCNVIFEYSDTATPTITISDAVYNNKTATAWFVDPTVRNIKIIAPKDSIVNTLY